MYSSSETPAVDSAADIQIACTLGGSVVQVEQLTRRADTCGSRRSAGFIIAAGVLFLLVSAFAFARGVLLAGTNERALRYHTEILKLDAPSFRPTRLSVVFDYMAFGGLGFGLAAVGFGVFRFRGQRGRREFTVGSGEGADFAAAFAPSAATVLVSTEESTAKVVVLPGMRAEHRGVRGVRDIEQLVRDGAAHVRGDGSHVLRLPADGSVRLSSGDVGISVTPVEPPTRSFLGGTLDLDGRAARFLLGTALVHAVVLMLLGAIPPESSQLALGLGENNSRMTHIASKAAETVEPELDDDAVQDEGEGSDAAQEASTGSKGKAGTPDNTAAAGKTQIARRADKPQISRERAVAMAAKQGVLGDILANDYFSRFDSMSDFSSDNADSDSWGSNGRDGSSAGRFGWSHTGFGPGGGGDNNGIIRVTDGETPWAPPGKTGNRVGLRKRGQKSPTTRVPGPASVSVGIDKATIRRYIRRQRDRFTYAYERALLTEAGLGGTVTVSFIIGSNGAVIQAHVGGIGDAEFHSRIGRIFRAIKFPRPGHGGIVRVVYPLEFRRAG